MRIANRALRATTPAHPPPFKRKLAATEKDGDEAEKSDRQKLLKMMNPRADRVFRPSFVLSIFTVSPYGFSHDIRCFLTGSGCLLLMSAATGTGPRFLPTFHLILTRHLSYQPFRLHQLPLPPPHLRRLPQPRRYPQETLFLWKKRRKMQARAQVWVLATLLLQRGRSRRRKARKVKSRHWMPLEGRERRKV